MTFVTWLYERLLKLYPASFRRTYGGDMVEMFGARAADAWSQLSPLGLAWFTGRELLGLLAGAADQRIRGVVSTEGRQNRRREGIWSRLMTGWSQEIRHALGRLAKNPGFTLATVLTLSLGIGANTAIFSVVNSVVLSALPYPDSEELVWLDHAAPGLNPDTRLQMTPGLYVHYRGRSQTLSEVALWSDLEATLTGHGDPTRVTATRATYTLGTVLGVQPFAGRWFTENDRYTDGTGVVVLSFGLWTSHFGGDPAVLGRTIQLNGFPLEVVGIMPASFTFPNEAMRALARSSANTKLWIPSVIDPATQTLGSFTTLGIARLKPGVSAKDAQRELDGLLSLLPEAFPGQIEQARQILDDARLSAIVLPLKEHVVGNVRQTLWILLGTVGFVLLIACANVANLLLVRAESRRHEVAVRRALGAERADLVRFFLTESSLLTLAGAGLGLGLAYLGVRTLVAFGPEDLPRLGEVSINGQVLAFTGGVSSVVSALFTAIPLVRGTHVVKTLTDVGRGSTAGHGRLLVRNTLVTTQVALTLVLLVGSGLMLRSFWRLKNVDPGFTARDDVVTFQTGLPQGTYPANADAAAFYQELIERLGTLPGVESVGVITCIPLDGWCAGNPLQVEGRVLKPGILPEVVAIRRASPGYFEAMGIPLLRGRVLERADHEERTGSVVVSAALAETFFPGEDPIGRRVYPSSNPVRSGWHTIVGVVGNVPANSVSRPADPLIYQAMASQDERGISSHSMTVLVRAPGQGVNLVGLIRAEVGAMDGSLALAHIRTMGDVVADARAQTAFTMVLMGISALVALLLGGVGIYGVIAYVVNLRRGEIGIRMALGADASTVHRMVLRQGGALTTIGIGLGLSGAYGLTRLMDALLFDVSRTDPITYVGVSLLLVAVAAVATSFPARKAAAIDPIEALRGE